MLWPVLGLMRFFLALVVATSHLTWYVQADSKVLAIQNFSGLEAVLGFLMISGYSIAASYSKQKDGFYRRRALRIVPLYVLLVGFSALCPALLGRHAAVSSGPLFLTVTPRFGELLGNLFFLQGFLVKPINTDPVVWTLSIEVFFYLMTPLIARLSQRVLIVAVFGSVAMYAYSSLVKIPLFWELLYGRSVLLLGWAWLLGFWAYRARDSGDTLIIALSLGIFANTPNNASYPFLWPFTWTITILGIGYAGRFSCHRRIAKAFSLLGDASYPLYLAHMPVFLLVYGFHLSKSGYLYILVAVVLSVVLDRCFDRPLKRFIAAIDARKPKIQGHEPFADAR